MRKPAILLFDIEIISYHMGDTWRRMSADCSSVCSFGYKWLGDKKAKCVGLDQWPDEFKKNPFNDKKLVEVAHGILSDADAVIAHYGNKFDVKYMRTKFAMHGLDPQVLSIPTRDTCLLCRSKFKFSSNRLNNIAKQFGCEEKIDTNEELWYNVMRSDLKAMKEMNKYCKQDIEVLDQVYKKIHHLFPKASWPHAGVAIGEDRDSCKECGSTAVWKYGVIVTAAGRYPRFQCQECGHVFRGSKMLKETDYE